MKKVIDNAKSLLLNRDGVLTKQLTRVWQRFKTGK